MGKNVSINNERNKIYEFIFDPNDNNYDWLVVLTIFQITIIS